MLRTVSSDFLLLFLLVAASATSCAQTAAPLTHFAEIDKNVYVGSKPHSDKDFDFLRSQHIRYILNARFLPFLSGLEERKAKRYGMQFLSVPMNASPIPPSRKHVNQILLTMRDAQFQPVYVHCVLGRDRTSLLSGLYKIYFLGVSKGDAWAEMRQSGFKTWWILHGLKAYFDREAGRPPSPSKHPR
jgi:protein-tyrosine phosphatase